MKILKNLAITLVVLIVILCGIGLVLPDTVHLERSTTINAPPAKVFNVLNSFKLFNQWSPWVDQDPNTKYAITGPAEGVGAKQAWESESPDVGSGSQEIIESVPHTLIRQKLVFTDFDTDNTASFTLTPQGEATQVTWSYDSSFGGKIMYRYFGLMLDGMLGPDYERGLARLKTLVESLPAESASDASMQTTDASTPTVDFSTLKVETLEANPVTVAYASASTTNDDKAVGAALDAAYKGSIAAFMKAHSLKQTGAPMAIYDACEPDAQTCVFRPALPVDNGEVLVPADSDVKLTQLGAGKTLRVTHTGTYKNLAGTYKMLLAHMAAQGLQRNGAPWEQYMNDPKDVAEAELATHIYMPLK